MAGAAVIQSIRDVRAWRLSSSVTTLLSMSWVNALWSAASEARVSTLVAISFISVLTVVREVCIVSKPFMTVSERVVAKELSLVSSCWLTLMSNEAVSFSTVRAEMLEGSDDDAVMVLSFEREDE